MTATRATGSARASLLLDLGSTAVKAAVLPEGADAPVSTTSAPMPAALAGRPRSRHESDPVAILAVVHEVLRRAWTDARRAGLAPHRIAVSCQMHSVLLTDARDAPISPLLSWQDDRLTEPVDGGTRLDAVLRSVPESRRSAAGIARRPGYGAANLAAHLAEAPAPLGSRIHTLGTLVSRSLGGPYATHRSMAASLGLLDTASGAWDHALAAEYGLAGFSLPEVVDAFRSAGTVDLDGVALDWFPDLGDHQVSVLGGGGLAADEVAISLGTAGIVARWAPTPLAHPLVDSRPYPGGGFLRAISRMPGGRFAGQVGELAAGIASGLTGIEVAPGALLAEASARVDTPADPPALALSEGRDAGGGAVPVLHGTAAGADVVSELLHAVARFYGERYREAVEVLSQGLAAPVRMRFNGGLATASPWFRERFAAELGLPSAPLPDGELALAGLAALLREHDLALSAASADLDKESA